MPEPVFTKLKAEADRAAIPLNRLVVQVLQGYRPVELSGVVAGLERIYSELHRCPVSLKEVEATCQLCEYFLRSYKKPSS